MPLFFLYHCFFYNVLINISLFIINTDVYFIQDDDRQSNATPTFEDDESGSSTPVRQQNLDRYCEDSVLRQEILTKTYIQNKYHLCLLLPPKSLFLF